MLGCKCETFSLQYQACNVNLRNISERLLHGLHRKSCAVS